MEAEHPRPRRLLVHLTDLHLLASGLLAGAVDPAARLRDALAALEGSGLRPDALVLTGDLAHDGEPAAYRLLRELVDPLAARLGAEVVWGIGNHDDRAAFGEILLGEDPAAPGPVDRVHRIGGLRVLALDTTVPGAHHGGLAEGQLAWLAAQLAEPAPEGTVLAMHHAPLPCVQDLAVRVELRGQRALAAVLRGTDVRAILGGHLHHSGFGTFAGIPVSVSGGTCYTQDLLVPVGGQRAQDGGQGLHLVHVYEDTVLHSLVPLGPRPSVGAVLGPEEAAVKLAAADLSFPGDGPVLPGTAGVPLRGPAAAVSSPRAP
jgi:3',5'-cyclic AMP phosphodiesterase CpdA